MARLFIDTLQGVVFRNLLTNSISSWAKLEAKFLSHFYKESYRDHHEPTLCSSIFQNFFEWPPCNAIINVVQTCMYNFLDTRVLHGGYQNPHLRGSHWTRWENWKIDETSDSFPTATPDLKKFRNKTVVQLKRREIMVMKISTQIIGLLKQLWYRLINLEGDAFKADHLRNIGDDILIEDPQISFL